MKSILLELPEPMYDDIERMAAREHRPIEQWIAYRLHIYLYGQAEQLTDEEYAALIATKARKYPRINLKAKDRNKIFEKCDGKCYHCHGPLVYGQLWHVDHLVPISKGGSNDLSNLVPSCARCNLEKRDKMPAAVA